MAEESKPEDPVATGKGKAAEEASESQPATAQVESDNEDDTAENPPEGSSTAPTASSKKKKSKRRRIKNALTGKSNESSGSSSKDDVSKAIGSLSKEQVAEFMKLNPALAQQVTDSLPSGSTDKDAADAMKKLSLEEILTGLAQSGKNVKDMASYKFWQTQPVPKFGESAEVIEEGPFKIIDPEQVPKQPGPLVDGFEWVTVDITSDEEATEVFQLLHGHYVEDDEAMFRFNYSKSFLRWWVLRITGKSAC
jgi:glycylpeptide N-tetradecanoyltransferase